MRLELDFDKSVEENASLQFEQAKRAKRKLVGLKAAIDRTREKIASQPKEKKKVLPAKKKKTQWFHSFRWFVSSDGFLVVGGRSAKSNEQLVKKHFDETDMFLHADIPGGAACIVKSQGKEIPDGTLKEAAQFAAVFSKAWQSGLSSIDVYAVSKQQVSKSAPSGTALSTGAFMIYGKRKWFKKTPLRLAVAVTKEGELISGPVSATKKSASRLVELFPGKLAASEAAKKLAVALEKGKKVSLNIDEIVKAIPGNGIALKLN